MPRSSRNSTTNAIPDLEHDATAVALQEALGSRVLLVKVIGQGGMGRVYLGRDPQLKRFVAVKVLLQSLGSDAEAHARFQREAQAIAAVSHPNVVAIYGIGELPDGTPYFVMQHVAGGSMAERLFATGPLPVDTAEYVLGDVAAALAAAHKRGIVHRDVKPANVLWDEESERATVSDFGIASIYTVGEEEPDVRITGSGMAVGSPAYMSPEQLLTEPITPKSDIYALGLLGYELLTGHGPYQTMSPSEVVAAHLRDEPRRLSELRPEVSPQLEHLLLRCLAKQPADRPSAEEVMLGLTPGAAEALEWPPPGLEQARGVLWRFMVMPAIGTIFLLFPLLFLVMFGGSSIAEGSITWTLVLAVSSLLGFAAYLRGGARLWRVGSVLVRAAGLGYGWGTIAEVMSDRRGDTGSLIAGTREYSGLSRAATSRMRALRVVEGALLFLAAPIALMLAIVALVTRGSQPGGDRYFVGVVFSALAIFGGGGLVASLYERARLARVRHRRAERPHHTNEEELAPAWYAAFERSREGQTFGPGRRVSRALALTTLLLGTGVVVFCASVILMSNLATVTGQFWSDFISQSQSTWLRYDARRMMRGAAYRLPPDGKTTPLEAGDALLAVASTAWSRPRTPSPIERKISSDYPQFQRIAPPSGLFPKPREMLWTTAAIVAAGTGLTPEQRSLLEQASAHPGRDGFSRAALASSVDLYGALLKLPLTEPIHPAAYPFVSLSGVRNAAESHAALVALDIANHKAADAERHAREIIAVGAMLLEVHVIPNVNDGAEVLARGIGALEGVYVATGREHEARVLLDSIVSATGRDVVVYIRPGAAGVRQAMRNPRFLRGARMEMIAPMVYRSCSDPRQLLFGVDDAFRQTIAYARDSLARFPSERVWVDAIEGIITVGLPPPTDAREPGGVFNWMAEAVDGLVGGKRFEGCASIRSSVPLRR